MNLNFTKLLFHVILHIGKKQEEILSKYIIACVSRNLLLVSCQTVVMYVVTSYIVIVPHDCSITTKQRDKIYNILILISYGYGITGSHQQFKRHFSNNSFKKLNVLKHILRKIAWYILMVYIHQIEHLTLTFNPFNSSRKSLSI